MATVMFAIYVAVYEIFAVEICTTLTFRKGQAQMAIESLCGTFCLMAIVIFFRYVTIYEILTVLCKNVTLTCIIGQDQM